MACNPDIYRRSGFVVKFKFVFLTDVGVCLFVRNFRDGDITNTGNLFMFDCGFMYRNNLQKMTDETLKFASEYTDNSWVTGNAYW